ncbi:MAG: acyltransferase family protein [Lachnospiraceae bacterium]|nr:acyltransferase family protein [Lachnospiraceae bacterium]
MDTQTQQKTDRKAYLDYLRILATFAVIFLHVSGSAKGEADVNTFYWQVLNFLEGSVRWGVPVFVMISGALFLNREIPVKKVYTSYVLRMVVAFFVWSFIYAVIRKGTIYEKLELFLCGEFHMWFIPMITGIYICLPFVKPLVSKEKTIKYFMLISFIFVFVIPEIIRLISDFGGELSTTLAGDLGKTIDNMNMGKLVGYMSIFVLGFYLDKLDMSGYKCIVIYLLGASGFLFTIMLTAMVSLKTQQSSNDYFGYHTVNVLFEAVLIFVLLKKTCLKNERINALVARISKCCFGIYLVHPLSWALVRKIYLISGVSSDAVVYVFITSVSVFLISLFVSWILNFIPYVGRYVV